VSSNQGALSAAKMCRAGCAFGSLSSEPAGIRTFARSDRLTGMGDPQSIQKHRTAPCEDLYTRTRFSPRVQEKLVRDARAKVKKALPENFLHMVQWQWDMRWTGPLTSKATAPQRQLPRIAEVKVVCFAG
jgi:hypothetical protein